MRTEEIKKLIKSFYDGKTSQSEELLLQDYFNSKEVVDDLMKEKKLFLEFYEKGTVNVPKSLEATLNNLIDQLDEKEPKKERLSVKRIALWSGVAASVAILLGTGIYINTLSLKGDYSSIAEKGEQNKNAIHITDSEYMEAENAMRLLSSNFNKGMEQLDEMNSKIEQTNDIINRTFNK